MPQPLAQFLNRIIPGEAREVLRQLPSDSIDCVVTSPPYWSLRDYEVKGQLGLEPDFRDYVARLCDVFDEVKRVLKGSGTCWVNIGDTYFNDSAVRKTAREQFKEGPVLSLRRSARSPGDLKKKSLVQVPSRFAVEMAGRGWILRNEIIWHKPNCMPSSAKDRFTVDFEKLFFFVKKSRYYFKQQFEELCGTERLPRRLFNIGRKRKRIYGDKYIAAINPKTAEASRLRILERGRNKRCVWRVTTRPFRGDHFAVFPQGLIETPIKAGCPEGGVVLDPFMGSGTTAVVARRLKRRFIGVDISPKYVRMAKDRLRTEAA